MPTVLVREKRLSKIGLEITRIDQARRRVCEDHVEGNVRPGRLTDNHWRNPNSKPTRPGMAVVASTGSTVVTAAILPVGVLASGSVGRL